MNNDDLQDETDITCMVVLWMSELYKQNSSFFAFWRFLKVQICRADDFLKLDAGRVELFQPAGTNLQDPGKLCSSGVSEV